MTIRTIWGAVLLCFIASAQQGAFLTVQGADGAVVKLSAGELAALPSTAIQITDHGAPVVFDGVLLAG